MTILDIVHAQGDTGLYAAQTQFLTWAVVVIIVVSITYFVVVLVSEIYLMLSLASVKKKSKKTVGVPVSASQVDDEGAVVTGNPIRRASSANASMKLAAARRQSVSLPTLPTQGSDVQVRVCAFPCRCWCRRRFQCCQCQCQCRVKTVQSWPRYLDHYPLLCWFDPKQVMNPMFLKEAREPMSEGDQLPDDMTPDERRELFMSLLSTAIAPSSRTQVSAAWPTLAIWKRVRGVLCPCDALTRCYSCLMCVRSCL